MPTIKSLVMTPTGSSRAKRLRVHTAGRIGERYPRKSWYESGCFYAINPPSNFSTMIKFPLQITLSLVACSLLTHAENKKPHIIFLFADDQSTYSVGCYGNKDVQTPEMDKLGADGMIFDRHYDTTAICMASRANAFTGMYEYKTGTNFSHGDMKPEVWAKSYPCLLYTSPSPRDS